MIALQVASIWPTDAAGWVSLIGGALLIGGIVGGILSWWLRVKLNGMGRRLIKMEAGYAHSAEVSLAMEKKQQAFEFAVMALTKDMGEVKAKLDELRNIQVERFAAMESDARKWIVQLAHIESKMGSSGSSGSSGSAGGRRESD